MRKNIFSIILLMSCCAVFSGCIKNTPYTVTINPYLTATVSSSALPTYNFTAATVVPSTIDTQVNNSDIILQISGNGSDVYSFSDKIVLQVARYNGVTTGVSSIVMSQAGAAYIHNGIPDVALGGIVAITKITSNSIIGYFSFTTASGASITNGSFNVGKP